MEEMKVSAAPKKSPWRITKEERELAIYNDYNEFMSYPEAQNQAAEDFIMKKYQIFSRATVWTIRKRVEQRFAAASRKGIRS